VAERQGKYLAGMLNKIGKDGAGHANSAKEIELGDPFVYKHLGSMATIGRYKALVDLRQSKVINITSLLSIKTFSAIIIITLLTKLLQEGKGLALAGVLSFFIWRSAYITRVVSWRNRFYVFVNWITTLIFGRDISRL
jgi:NADH:ubiquinone reductase (non-electrogenic)